MPETIEEVVRAREGRGRVFVPVSPKVQEQSSRKMQRLREIMHNLGVARKRQ